MRKLTVGVVLSISSTLGAVAMLAAPAAAATPVVQGCVGSTFSAAAQASPFPGAIGHAVESFAQAPDARPGLGDGIQALQAGDVTQDVVPNTCNG
jgi:hypothetical protein